MFKHPRYVTLLQLQQAILAGELDVLSGTRRICAQLGSAGLIDESIGTVFVGGESETDHLPIGAERTYWNAEALRRMCEAFYRERVLSACRALIDRFGPA
jgi:hypothetical protein